ncbi:tail fiber protein [Paenibacillus sanguinis]|uniref:tail fiber protein n=1 Tax=Paenibacillus sanguinis TaxID=225906 RepID=UPI00035C5227|nr:tail fiber protein [Paenibacillus sanguinis]
MAIQEPRKFVPTDQGHADVLNVPITTLYENDQELAAQVENIRSDPAGNGVVPKEAFDQYKQETQTQINGAVQSAKDYTHTYAAPKSHTHSASDLPSASTQARGIVQLNTSTSSSATNQAATPSAVKAAYDAANAAAAAATAAQTRANEAFTQASNGKTQIAAAITGKGVPATGSDTFQVLAQKVGRIQTSAAGIADVLIDKYKKNGSYRAPSETVTLVTLPPGVRVLSFVSNMDKGSAADTLNNRSYYYYYGTGYEFQLRMVDSAGNKVPINERYLRPLLAPKYFTRIEYNYDNRTVSCWSLETRNSDDKYQILTTNLPSVFTNSGSVKLELETARGPSSSGDYNFLYYVIDGRAYFG